MDDEASPARPLVCTEQREQPGIQTLDCSVRHERQIRSRHLDRDLSRPYRTDGILGDVQCAGNLRRDRTHDTPATTDTAARIKAISGPGR